MTARTLRIAIIGAGPGGLCMGKRLLDEGFDDFVILERADDLGGTWNANRYPGCETDTPAVLYAFSFEQATNSSHIYFKQPEILNYLRNLADKYALRSHCRFGQAVTQAKWSEDTSYWTLMLDSGETVEAEVVVSAMGLFNQPHWPKIDGLDKFKGVTMHSSQWDADHDFSNDRVAVIGSGASAVQLVPELVKIASQVHFFQRTPNYVRPKESGFLTNEQYRAVLAEPEFYRELRASMEHYLDLFVSYSDEKNLAELKTSCLQAMISVHDPEVRRKLHPSYPIGSRRIFFTNSFYPAFNQANLELVTTPVKRVTKHSIVCSDDTERLINTLVLATGFEVSNYLSAIDVTGRHGRRIDVKSHEHLKAYLGMMSAGFPNLFMLLGPNTYNGSAPAIIEIQVNYIIAHLQRMTDQGLSSVEVKSSSLKQYDRYVQSQFKNPEWAINNYDYYIPSTGRNFKSLPFTVEEYRRLTASIDPAAFRTTSKKQK